MAETAKRLRTAGDASTESAGKDGARAAVEPAGSAASMPAELRAGLARCLSAAKITARKLGCAICVGRAKLEPWGET